MLLIFLFSGLNINLLFDTGSTHQLSNKEKLSPDDELLEIIRDFKNNVFTISEVETLVQNWQSRNDVQQSFREKKVIENNFYVTEITFMINTYYWYSDMVVQK